MEQQCQVAEVILRFDLEESSDAPKRDSGVRGGEGGEGDSLIRLSPFPPLSSRQSPARVPTAPLRADSAARAGEGCADGRGSRDGSWFVPCCPRGDVPEIRGTVIALPGPSY